MSDYSFIIDGVRFSYSSVSTFETCPYAFKLTYIDVLPRLNNFFAEYGSFTHECLEKYFNGELELFELSQYYIENYDAFVTSISPVGLEARYKEQGQAFFDNFSVDRNDYEILVIEDKIDFTIKDVLFVAKPDLVLRNKKTQKTGLYDYKTSVPFRKNKKTGIDVPDTKKINGYYNQMYLYTFALRKAKNISVDEITLWFTRADKEIVIPWSPVKEQEAQDWLLSVVGKIKTENAFMANASNPFFCNNLCGVRDSCIFRE